MGLVELDVPEADDFEGLLPDPLCFGEVGCGEAVRTKYDSQNVEEGYPREFVDEVLV